jgi:L-fuculose-phosphate aldolase
MWITPSGVPRYLLRASELVNVNIQTGRLRGKKSPSTESEMHRMIYLACPGIRGIVHTHSPYTIAASITSGFTQVIEEAKIVVGKPVIIPHWPSGSKELAEAVAEAFVDGAKAVIVKNHGVVAGSADIHQARAIIESLEEWSKILAISRLFGGTIEYLGG